MHPNARINWPAVSFLCSTPPIAAVLTFHYLRTHGFDWSIWALGLVMYALTAGSITAGYHRYFAHRTYESATWVKWFWALFGAASFQNSILVWARDHRVHHRFVDSDRDPYSINKGFFYAHFGWMLVIEPEVANLRSYGRDFERDPVVMFQHRHYVPIAFAMCFGLPTLVGWMLGSAYGGFVVGGVLRVVLVHHMTFFINSFCHTWGKQTYTNLVTARDSLLMALATFGEGYHNFHHAFAMDYRNGIRWYHWDPTKWIIKLLQMMGAAYDLKRTPDGEIIARRLEMDQLRLQSRLDKDWHAPIQAQIESLRARVVASHRRFEELREEYRSLAKDYAQAGLQRLEERRVQLRMAKIEFRAASRQWRAYHHLLLQGV